MDKAVLIRRSRFKLTAPVADVPVYILIVQKPDPSLKKIVEPLCFSKIEATSFLDSIRGQLKEKESVYWKNSGTKH